MINLETAATPEEVCEKIKHFVQNIMCRKFTKRQYKILGIIHLFCMHNTQMECYIPHLSSFEVTGIARTKIHEEIEKLVEANVISWDSKRMIFRINNCTRLWKIPLSENYKQSKMQQIKDLNDVIYKHRPR